MIIKREWIILSAIILGIIETSIWWWSLFQEGLLLNIWNAIMKALIGDPPYNFAGFFAWFAIGAPLRLIISIILIFIDTKSLISKRIFNSVLFFVIACVSFLVSFWIIYFVVLMEHLYHGT
jgi:hypothetical protein